MWSEKEYVCNNRQEWAKAACDAKSKDGWVTLKEGCGGTFEAVIMEGQSKVDKKYRENTRGEILVRHFSARKLSEVTKISQATLLDGSPVKTLMTEKDYKVRDGKKLCESGSEAFSKFKHMVRLLDRSTGS